MKPTAGYPCPKCQNLTHVLECRRATEQQYHGGPIFRRRRECLRKACRRRFTTYEIILGGDWRHYKTKMDRLSEVLREVAVLVVEPILDKE